MAAKWTDELRAKVIKEYEEAGPTPENTTEITKMIADGLGETFTPNGVLAILNKAGVYVSKSATKATTSSSTTSTGKRINKTEAINSLKDAIEATGLEVDEEIIGKMTGKCAVYITTLIEKLTEEED